MAARPGHALVLAALPTVRSAAAQTGSSALSTAPEAGVGEIQIMNLTPYTLVSTYAHTDQVAKLQPESGC